MNDVINRSASDSVAVNKVLKNTFMLLGLTLAFSSGVAYVAIQMNAQMINVWLMLGLYFANLFALTKLQNSVWALPLCFSLTGLLGYTIGPVVGMYMDIPGGTEIVTTSMGLTALVFFGLSSYAMISKKDFSFMTGFVCMGILVAFVLGLLSMIFAWSAMSMAVSAAFVFLSSAVILMQVSSIVRGGEDNYIMATVTIFVSLYNIFSSLLHLFGIGLNDD